MDCHNQRTPIRLIMEFGSQDVGEETRPLRSSLSESLAHCSVLEHGTLEQH